MNRYESPNDSHRHGFDWVTLGTDRERTLRIAYPPRSQWHHRLRDSMGDRWLGRRLLGYRLFYEYHRVRKSNCFPNPPLEHFGQMRHRLRAL